MKLVVVVVVVWRGGGVALCLGSEERECVCVGRLKLDPNLLGEGNVE